VPPTLDWNPQEAQKSWNCIDLQCRVKRLCGLEAALKRASETGGRGRTGDLSGTWMMFPDSMPDTRRDVDCRVWVVRDLTVHREGAGRAVVCVVCRGLRGTDRIVDGSSGFAPIR
jgi:hypothetical protein